MSTNLGPALEKGIWAAVVIAAVIVILRVFAKIKIKRFGVDDGIMILAEVDLPCLFPPLSLTRCLVTGNRLNSLLDLVSQTWIWQGSHQIASRRPRGCPRVYRHSNPHRDFQYYLCTIRLHRLPSPSPRYQQILQGLAMGFHDHPIRRQHRFRGAASQYLP